MDKSKRAFIERDVFRNYYIANYYGRLKGGNYGGFFYKNFFLCLINPLH